MENAEACFYKELGWLNNQGDNVNKNAILKDLDNLKDANIKQTFNKDINLCVNWNGKFGPSRMKRSAEDPTEEVDFIDDLTSIVYIFDNTSLEFLDLQRHYQGRDGNLEVVKVCIIHLQGWNYIFHFKLLNRKGKGQRERKIWIWRKSAWWKRG